MLAPSLRRHARRSIVALFAVGLVASACGIRPPVPPPGNKLLVGIGPELNVAETMRLPGEAPVGMYTSWYNGPGDLDFMLPWKDVDVPAAYSRGRALHLVVWAKGAEREFEGKYGTSCGRKYPLSNRFLDDMKTLAQIFGGPASGPPLFVTLFTEFQTYPCTDNEWNPDAPTNNYLRALRDRYVEARQVFKSNAPNARVSLGWGGWQTRWDKPETGGGRSMFQHFDAAMRSSDFQSFQAMQSDHNVDDIKAMTKVLGEYGPVMVAHYKPDNRSQVTFDADVAAIFNDSFLSTAKGDGLFAFSFMDDKNMATEPAFQAVKSVVSTYGAMP